MTSVPLEQILTWLQSVLRWEFLPQALVGVLFGCYAVWSLLHKARPFPPDLMDPPPFDEAGWMRVWGGFEDFAEDLARARAKWPSKWREETQLARQTWQETEERRVKGAHKIGLIVLVTLLVFYIQLVLEN